METADKSTVNNTNPAGKGKYIDLHLHLDGSITPEIAGKLALVQGIELPARGKELEKLLTLPADCESLDDFLKCFALPCSLMQTYEGLSAAAFEVAEKMKRDGCIYGEIRYAPQLHTSGGMTQEDAVNAVLDGLKNSTFKANVILCCMRGQGNEKENFETLELAKTYLVEDGGVVAMDIAGAEAIFTTDKYRDLFSKAKEYGVPFTIHAGEAAGAESVALALEYGASRIGHGVRSREDHRVLETLKSSGIFLEMCPTSNRQTKAVADMKDYPIMDYLDYGLKVTVNTDDPAIEGTDIANEFRYLEEKFGLTRAQKKIILENSVEGAFTTESVKKALRRELGLI